jgi:DNA-binding transcriptional regulator LsrR (DeoR family)
LAERKRLAVGSGHRLAHGDDDLRLIATVARMYHERGLSQPQIAGDLHISQPRVSRLLKRAQELGIVRTIVTVPEGVHSDVEDAMVEAYGRFGLANAIVVESPGPGDPARALGAAAAQYLSATFTGHDRVGVSSWSATILAVAEAMRPARARTADSVVQVMGGLGDPRVQMQASRLMGLLASATKADPVFMPAPGVLTSKEARDSLVADPSIASVMDLWRELTVVLVGIGPAMGSQLLRESGNALADSDRASLMAAGAVGDVCLRFFDAEGRPIESSVNDRLITVSYEVLKGIPRRVGVAGGAEKHAAIRGALLGGWANILITDLEEAHRLLESAPA